MRLCQLLIVITLSAFIAACGNGDGLQIDRKTKLKRDMNANLTAVTNSMLKLSNSLQRGTITSAVVLASYAKEAIKKKPEFKDIINILASEGTVDGPTYLSITDRLEDARKEMPNALKSIESANKLNEEFKRIIAAAQDYDVMLIDAINMLSDFTDGKLPKMRELQYENPTASTAPVGSEYVGNTNYGHWKQDSSGHSFWAFYGQYAMFSALLGGPTYYDGWSNNRRPSYYHDYVRDSYSSPAGRANQSDALQKTKKRYTSKGKTFKSSYARSHPTIKGEKPGTRPIFKSSYAKKTFPRNASSRSDFSYGKPRSYNSRSLRGGRSLYGRGK